MTLLNISRVLTIPGEMIVSQSNECILTRCFFQIFEFWNYAIQFGFSVHINTIVQTI